MKSCYVKCPSWHMAHGPYTNNKTYRQMKSKSNMDWTARVCMPHTSALVRLVNIRWYSPEPISTWEYLTAVPPVLRMRLRKHPQLVYGYPVPLMLRYNKWSDLLLLLIGRLLTVVPLLMVLLLVAAAADCVALGVVTVDDVDAVCCPWCVVWVCVGWYIEVFFWGFVSLYESMMASTHSHTGTRDGNTRNGAWNRKQHVFS